MTDTLQQLTLIEPQAPESLLPGSWTWVWLAALGAVAAAGAAIGWISLRRRPTHAGQVHQDNAMADALLALEQTPVGSIRETATRVSLILRRFLANTTGDTALFETHEEFVARHDALATLDERAREHTASTFARLASVKYAPHDSHGSAVDLINDARSLLHSLTTPPSTP